MAPGFVHVTEVVGARGRGQDRAGVHPLADGLVIALADGAGGTANASQAAQAVLDAAFASPPAWPALLDDLDRGAVRRTGGQTTAVVLSVTSTGILGASVGDSGAWIIRATTIDDLTAHQSRKPLLGAGCVPCPFHGGLDGGTLLVASDGLLKYATPSTIARLAAGADLALAARALVDLVRLPSGQLQDDVSLVLCRASG